MNTVCNSVHARQNDKRKPLLSADCSATATASSRCTSRYIVYYYYNNLLLLLQYYQTPAYLVL